MKLTPSLSISFLSVSTGFFCRTFSLTFADMFFLLCLIPKEIEGCQGNNLSLTQSNVLEMSDRVSETTNTFDCTKK